MANAISGNTSNLETDPSCSTGDCIFPVFSSLAICSNCIDIKYLLQQSSNCTGGEPIFHDGKLKDSLDCTYWLPMSSSDLNHAVNESPGGSWTMGKGGSVSFTWIPTAVDTYVLSSPPLKIEFLFGPDSNGSGEIHLSRGEVIQSFFAALALIKPTPAANVTKSARVDTLSTADICALSVCAREYNISMASGITHSEVVLTSYSKLTINDTSLGQGAIDWSYTFGFPNNLSNINFVTSTFGFPFETKMSTVLEKILNGGLLEPVSEDIFTNMLRNGMNASPDIPKTMDRIAAAMTNRLRDMSSHTVPGQSVLTGLYVRVFWLWLLLPVFSVILGTVLLVSVMITTRRHKLPIWKTSELALLFHSFDFQVDHRFKMHKASHMEDIASALRIRLGRNANGVLKLKKKSE